MADFTTNMTSTASMPGLVQTAFDRYVEFALRSQPLLRGIVDKHPVQQAMPGSVVTLSLYNDLAPTTATLVETEDTTHTELPDVTQVPITLLERGRSVVKTRVLGEFSLADVDPAIANQIAYNLADSMDAVVYGVAKSGSNVAYGSGGTTDPTTFDTIGNEDKITAADIRKVVAKMRAASVLPRVGNLYGAYIHPEVAHDLRAESGPGNWEDITKYTSSAPQQQGVLGVLHGAYIVETPRVTPSVNDLDTSVYTSLIVGQQALAEAVAVEPGVVIGPVTDNLNRFRKLGWYGLLGHAVYRDDALWRIESSSTIAG